MIRVTTLFLFLLVLLSVFLVGGCATKLTEGDRAFLRSITDGTASTSDSETSVSKPERREVVETEGSVEIPSARGGSGRTVTIIVVHHTAGSMNDNSRQVISSISELHSRRFKSMKPSFGLMVAYHYLITPNGKVWNTRDESDIGYHAGDWEVNKASVGICLVGNFEKYKPTRQQMKSLDLLVRRLQRERNITKVVPHSHCKATLCCGKHLEAEIRKLPWGEHF